MMNSVALFHADALRPQRWTLNISVTWAAIKIGSQHVGDAKLTWLRNVWRWMWELPWEMTQTAWLNDAAPFTGCLPVDSRGLRHKGGQTCTVFSSCLTDVIEKKRWNKTVERNRFGGLETLSVKSLCCHWSPQRRNKLTTMMLCNKINAKMMTEAINCHLN